MEKFKVNIEYCLGYYTATTNRGRYQICDFNKSDISDSWRFRPNGTGRIITIINEENPKEFPLKYFVNLCRSMLFLDYGTYEMPEVELTVASKKLLKIK